MAIENAPTPVADLLGVIEEIVGLLMVNATVEDRLLPICTAMVALPAAVRRLLGSNAVIWVGVTAVGVIVVTVEPRVKTMVEVEVKFDPVRVIETPGLPAAAAVGVTVVRPMVPIVKVCVVGEVIEPLVTAICALPGTVKRLVGMTAVS